MQHPFLPALLIHLLCHEAIYNLLHLRIEKEKGMKSETGIGSNILSRSCVTPILNHRPPPNVIHICGKNITSSCKVFACCSRAKLHFCFSFFFWAPLQHKQLFLKISPQIAGLKTAKIIAFSGRIITEQSHSHGDT